MTRMQQAYEALLDNLEEEMEHLQEKIDSEIIAIDLLLEFILDHHGPKVTKELAAAIEKKGGKDLVDFVGDKCYERGLDLVGEA